MKKLFIIVTVCAMCYVSFFVGKNYCAKELTELHQRNEYKRALLDLYMERDEVANKCIDLDPEDSISREYLRLSSCIIDMINLEQ